MVSLGSVPVSVGISRYPGQALRGIIPVMLPFIVIVAALPAEATPLKTHWNLSPTGDTAYRSWHNDDMLLVESGIGKCNAAAATASALTGIINAGIAAKRIICINHGIGGGLYDLGTMVTAHAINDDATGQTWYPSLTFKPSGATATVVCVDAPASDYTADTAFDMESSGFYSAARRFVGAEFIHCFKTISDNPDHDITTINKARVIDLVQGSLASLTQSIDRLVALHATAFDTADIEAMVNTIKENMHLTRTHGHQLRRLLERHQALHGALPTTATLLDLKRASVLISTLTQQLDGSVPRY